ncbi:MAG TPA: cytidine deaminase, partial [Gordonia sp. (in: high G+C Gram-positive bacteria)]|nr:cytidine deaminase [Gordonia sp. (in: high G+C Gram-positive bacteria)]
MSQQGISMSAPVPEDDKLIVLARGALARAETTSGAAVR